ncbi:glycosyltransferase family 32 protein (plasmid) [Burkholderia pyrrocinia]|uniref:glycosyltransferase family 32 protein n=1 Tax=Burkholderia pyrrocinia TaxID=60550 RepID=UPI0038B5AAC2
MASNRLIPNPELTYCVKIPIDEVECHPDGRYRVMLDGESRVVAFHAELKRWFLVEPSNKAPYGHVLTMPIRRTPSRCWKRDDGKTFPPDLPSSYQEVHLPAPILVPSSATAVPRILHFIWVGNAPIPDALARCIIRNARRCPGFQARLYIDTTDVAAQHRLTQQFEPMSCVTLVDLHDDEDFHIFLQTSLGKHYRHFASPAGNNYSAAADILRAYLLHREGGIYMDVDDVVSHPVAAHQDLRAAPDDVLLNRMVTVKEYDFSGYPYSNFACQPGNPVMATLLEEMTHRLSTAQHFLHQPRPWKTASDSNRAALLAYISKIFELVGPKVFNDVLQVCRPDYYFIERDLLSAYRIVTVSPSEPRVVVDRYFDAMHAAKAFYLPFAEPEFNIDIGSAHSWNPMQPQTTLRG